MAIIVCWETQNFGERVAGVGLFDASNLFRGALRNDAAASLAAFGPQIDEPISLFDDVEIVLDD